MKYTMETLKEQNWSYHQEHDVTEDDIEKVNKYVKFIEDTRSTTQPKVGDRVRHTTKYADYYPHAHIVHDGNGYGGNICEAGTSHIWMDKNGNNDIACSTSGGPFSDIDTSKMKYVGKEKNTFWIWGHCGATGNGGIYFDAEVSVWEYIDEELKDRVHTTKDFDRWYIYQTDRKTYNETGYAYEAKRGGGSGWGRAFKTKEDLEAWMKTFRVEKSGREAWGGSEAWSWKEEQHHLSPDEFDPMTEPEDTFLMNGSIRRCKRKYDEDNHTVHTYFVWYWGDDWMRNAEYQNKVIESYSYPWKEHRKEYELARKTA